MKNLVTGIYNLNLKKKKKNLILQDEELDKSTLIIGNFIWTFMKTEKNKM